MTELEKLVEECNVKLAELGYKIGSVVELIEEEKIGAPIPPKKKP